MNDPNKRPLGTRWCRVGSNLTTIGMVLVGIGLLCARLEILSPLNAFYTFGLGMFCILLSAPILTIGLAISGGSGGAVPAWRARLSLVISVGLIIAGGLNFANREKVPLIHDVTTDTGNPPEFVALVAVRAADEAKNPPEYSGAETAALQQEGFPDLETLRLESDADAVFSSAIQVVNELGWEIVAADQAALRLEATDTTRWFHFKDDVVVRVRATDGGTLVDVRSKSRVGRGDMGTNAKRVREFLGRLQAKIS